MARRRKCPNPECGEPILVPTATVCGRCHQRFSDFDPIQNNLFENEEMEASRPTKATLNFQRPKNQVRRRSNQLSPAEQTPSLFNFNSNSQKQTLEFTKNEPLTHHNTPTVTPEISEHEEVHQKIESSPPPSLTSFSSPITQQTPLHSQHQPSPEKETPLPSHAAPQPQTPYYSEHSDQAPIPARKPIISRRWNKRSRWAFVQNLPWLHIITFIAIALVCLGIAILFWQKITTTPLQNDSQRTSIPTINTSAPKETKEPTELITAIPVPALEALAQTKIPPQTDSPPIHNPISNTPWISPVEAELLPASTSNILFHSDKIQETSHTITPKLSEIESLQKHAFSDALLEHEIKETQEWLRNQKESSISPSLEFGTGYSNLTLASSTFLVHTPRKNGIIQLNLDTIASARTLNKSNFWQIETGKKSGTLTVYAILSKAPDTPSTQASAWLYLSIHPEAENHLIACPIELSNVFNKAQPAIVSLKWVQENGVDYPKVVAIEQIGW